MNARRAESCRAEILRAAIECFRIGGYMATTVDDICREAGVSKGAFFHHFASKEALAEACLTQWDTDMAAFDAEAPFQTIADPVERLFACMEFYENALSSPGMTKSCLAGTIAQEVFESHATLRTACDRCIGQAEERFALLVAQAADATGRKVDSASVGRFWAGALQGALILYKASGDVSVIRENLRHVRTYIESLVGDSQGMIGPNASETKPNR